MKRKILSILLLLVLVLNVTACGNKKKLNEIINKFNESETVKTYKEYGYEMTAALTDDKITITSVISEDKTTVDFKIEGNIISNDSISEDDLMATLLLIDSVGQASGYKEDELLENLNAFPDEIEKYTLKNEGLEIVLGEEKISLKIDISKKIPLIDMDNFYLKTDDFEIISEIVSNKETGNQTGKAGNIAYDVNVGKDSTTILIGQDKELSVSAYKSIVSAIEVIYGKDAAEHFQEVYPKFVDEKTTVEKYTIETDYKVEEDEETIFKDTKVVLVTIKNKTKK